MNLIAYIDVVPGAVSDHLDIKEPTCARARERRRTWTETRQSSGSRAWERDGRCTAIGPATTSVRPASGDVIS